MKVSCSRIHKLLKPEGFLTRGTSSLVESCEFSREDRTPFLYQQIDVLFAGTRKEAAVAYVAASTTRWIRLKGLSVSRLLDDIATDRDRGWSIITTADEACDWERSLARVGPVEVARFASEVGPALLERTKSARQAAQRLLARLDAEQSVSSQITQLQRAMSSAVVAEAQRLISWPGVMQLSESDEVYTLACLAVMNGDNSLLGQDPLVNDELMWQIQLVADSILSWQANLH